MNGHHPPDTDQPIMPRRSDPPAMWAKIGPNCGYHVHEVAELLCVAAKIPDPNWRGDWDTLVCWLEDDITSDDIEAAIAQVAARPGYRPPATLRYFDRPVRDFRGSR